MKLEKMRIGVKLRKATKKELLRYRQRTKVYKISAKEINQIGNKLKQGIKRVK